MKIAVVHDYLCGMGGSERVFQYICEEFSEADIYTLAYNPKLSPTYFKAQKIRTTWLNFFIHSMESFRWFFPISTYVMQSLNFNEYDLVITSSATVAKYIKVPNGIHICYCYIPTRALWQTDEYFGSSYKKIFLSFFLNYLRKRDINAANQVDKFISISKVTENSIKKIYNKDSYIIPSPIDLDKFKYKSKKSSNFLIVSRLEKWKKLDYAIEAFNKLGLPLRVIGTGAEEKKLRNIGKSNITFLGAVDDDTLAREYSSAKAVIFTPYLEFGLIPLEANASGTPVICFGKGGVLETMISTDNPIKNKHHPTAIFFYEQTPEALINAIKDFENYTFSSKDLVSHANKWGIKEFKKKLRQYVNKILD